MKINQRFNRLTKKEYFYYIDHHKKYSDFNTLGLYRSILENDKLNLKDKEEVRDYANLKFAKTFHFLQVKDPETWFKLTYLGQSFTRQEERVLWDNIRKAQEKILKDKRIKHRNFGTYSKHECGNDWCHLDGMMIKAGTDCYAGVMWFESDQYRDEAQERARQTKKDRKHQHQLIQRDWELDELE